MDSVLEEKLTKLRETGKQIEAVMESIQDKQQLVENLNRTAARLKGMPKIQEYADKARNDLLGEIEEEEKKLAALKQTL